MRFPFGVAFPSLGKARVCKSSKAGKSFSVRRWSDKSSSISPCRHPRLPHRLSSPSSFFSLLSSCPLDSLLHHLSHPLALSLADGRRRLKLTRVVRPSVLAYSVCSSTLLHRHTCALPSRTHTHVRSSSRRECAPMPASPRLLPFLRVRRGGEGDGGGACSLILSSDTMCARQEYTLLIAGGCEKEAGNTRNRSLPSLPAFCKLLSSPLRSSRERKRMWRYSAWLSIVYSWFARMNSRNGTCIPDRCLIILLLLKRERYVCTQAQCIFERMMLCTFYVNDVMSCLIV